MRGDALQVIGGAARKKRSFATANDPGIGEAFRCSVGENKKSTAANAAVCGKDFGGKDEIAP